MVMYTLTSTLYKIVTEETKKLLKKKKEKKKKITKQYKGRINIIKEKKFTMKFCIDDEKVKYFNYFNKIRKIKFANIISNYDIWVYFTDKILQDSLY